MESLGKSPHQILQHFHCDLHTFCSAEFNTCQTQSMVALKSLVAFSGPGCNFGPFALPSSHSSGYSETPQSLQFITGDDGGWEERKEKRHILVLSGSGIKTSIWLLRKKMTLQCRAIVTTSTDIVLLMASQAGLRISELAYGQAGTCLGGYVVQGFSLKISFQWSMACQKY